jgi:hypothetical protein
VKLRSIIAVPLALAACDAASAPSGGDAEAPSPVVAVVDSALTPQEHLRRFREGLEPVDTLAGGAGSREALVRRWVEAVEAADTAAVVAMHLTRAEFAYLYFPESPYASGRTRTPPDFLWMQFRLNSEKGIGRTFTRLAGRPLGYRALVCPEAPKAQGRSVLHERCLLRRDTEAGRVEQRLFGTIVERDGRFKFVSYANEF